MRITKDDTERSRREIRAEIAAMTAQIEDLAGELSGLGRSGVRNAKASAAQGLGLLAKTRDDLGSELDRIEARAGVAVRERPVRSLGIAVAIGFLLAVIWRR